MSFSKTISVFAALASIFAAGATGWKLADSQKEVPLSPLDQKVMELEKKLDQAQQPQITPQSVNLPTPQPQLPQTSQTLLPQLPPVPQNPEQQ
ncbi:MAG: hypothetical protein EBU90_17935 [Proteobacteria bacterium]|nr:hypothetical protein [Pseudomonadota bacterium]